MAYCAKLSISKRFRGALAATAVSALSAGVFAEPPGVFERFGKDVDAQVASNYVRVEALYRDIHMHPELAFAEVETAKKLAEQLRAAGFEVTEGVGRTGLVAIFRNGPGPKVMVRTELDALPMEEKTGLPFASKVRTTYLGKETAVAHTCGHDLHMAAWVGTARTLVAMKSQWSGTLMFIAQPAEEATGGAKAMIEDGLFKRFGRPDFAFALHTWPIEYGVVGYNVGPVTSNSDGVEITFKGRGAHGSAPDKSIDPVLIAARFVVDVQGVTSREKDPFEFGVFTVGAIQGGTAGNIIPDSVILRGTIRSYQASVRQKLQAGILRTARASAAMAGAPDPEVKIESGGDAVINDAQLVGRVEPVLAAALGSDHVRRIPPITPSEDFSEFVNAGIPSMFFFVGVHDPKAVAASLQPGGTPLPINHSPFFAPVFQPSVTTAERAMSLAVLTALQPS